jgi:hypothetical protein
VSYLPIPPPIWARISTDPIPPTIGPPLDLGGIPLLIPLSSEASCCCADPHPKFDQSRPICVASCIVYTTNGASETKIEVQLCKACSRRQIGPDCRSLGLFNYNNRVLFTHALLNDYTNHYTISETPITAWLTSMRRNYQVMGSSLAFMTAETFRLGWFAFVRIQ